MALPVCVEVRRPVDMVFVVYDDPMAALILGTPGLRRLGFKFEAPGTGGINLIRTPLAYKREFGLLRDVLVAQVHRDLGDRAYVGGKLCPPNLSMDESKYEQIEPSKTLRIKMSRTTETGFQYADFDEMSSDEDSDSEGDIDQEQFIRNVSRRGTPPLQGPVGQDQEEWAEGLAGLSTARKDFATSTPTETGGAVAVAPSFARLSVILRALAVVKEETGQGERAVQPPTLAMVPPLDTDQTPKTTERARGSARRLDNTTAMADSLVNPAPSQVEGKLNDILKAIAMFEERAQKTDATMREIKDGVQAMETRVMKLEVGFRRADNSTITSDQFATPPQLGREVQPTFVDLEGSGAIEKPRGEGQLPPNESSPAKGSVSDAEDVTANL